MRCGAGRNSMSESPYADSSSSVPRQAGENATAKMSVKLCVSRRARCFIAWECTALNTEATPASRRGTVRPSLYTEAMPTVRVREREDRACACRLHPASRARGRAVGPRRGACQTGHRLPRTTPGHAFEHRPPPPPTSSHELVAGRVAAPRLPHRVRHGVRHRHRAGDGSVVLRRARAQARNGRGRAHVDFRRPPVRTLITTP